MGNDEMYQQFARAAFADMDEANEFWEKKPLLAHYTSIDTVEKILCSGEIWLSNPLFMNDLDEVRFGFREARRIFFESSAIEAACGSTARWQALQTHFRSYCDEFDSDHVLDTFIFCLSEHRADDYDGVLSMWRGYGGNGSGAALVFDTARLTAIPGSPLALAQVQYLSRGDRTEWLKQKCEDFAATIASANPQDDQLYLAAQPLFHRLLTAAIFSKHHGFKEECEWRLAYMPIRDPERSFDRMFGYATGPKGVEPKLKLRLADIPGAQYRVADLIDRILLGPSNSSPLAVATVCRMLDHLGLPALKEKVHGSDIPFRERP